MSKEKLKVMAIASAFSMIGFSFFSQASFAQNAIAPDNTLPFNTLVDFNSANQTYTITGGTQVGGNQFHSFQDFSVPTSNTAHFDTAPTTVNAIGRVTGSNISNIDGILRTNGTTNLYLVNPNGITFGANAKLDITGSFSASTANSIRFSDGSEFSATNPQAPPLLNISVPMGLQYGNSNAGAAISSSGNLEAGQDLVLNADRLDLQGTLRSGRDLTLQAQDVVTIRDTVDTPFWAVAGRDLLVQGNQSVDVFALNNVNSGFWSGRNMVLRSQNPVIGDAHFYAGGNLKVEKLDGSLGNLISPNDPVVLANGDVSLGDYIGASLHILAGGSVTLGNVTINSTGDVATTINPNNTTLLFNATKSYADLATFNVTEYNTVLNSDGTIKEVVPVQTPITISGDTRATLDVRAGVDWLQLGGLTTSPTIAGTITPTPTYLDPPVNANITVNGNIRVSSAGGLVFLTNQFTPNALIGTISIKKIDTSITSLGGNGGDIRVDGRNSVTLRDSELNTINYILGNGGNVTITATDSVSFDNIQVFSSIDRNVVGNAGNININAGSVSFTNGSLLVSAIYDGGQGNAGNITITATGLVSFDNNSKLFSSIESNAVGNAGNININAGSVSFTNVSQLVSVTKGKGDAGNITITSSDLVSFDKGSGVFSNIDSKEVGDAGNININAGSVSFTNRSRLVAVTFVKGDAGNITITATDSIKFDGVSFVSSAVREVSEGNAGGIYISTQILELLGGSLIEASTSGPGDAGSIDITTQTLNLTNNSKIETNTSSSGNAGNISLTTGNLFLTDGVTVSASTTGSGKAGDISVKVNNDFILSNGASIQTKTSSSGDSGKIEVFVGNNLILMGNGTGLFADTTPESTGRGGSIFVDPPLVSITNGAGISVNSLGKGNGGNIDIFADKFIFANNAFLRANTASGEGGNINLQIAKIFFPRNNSSITATAAGTGNGGNITLSALFLVSLPSENNDIFANAFFGKGGNINITTQGIFGLAFRPRLTPLSDITASSDFGLQGNVNLNTPGVDPSKGLTNLPADIGDASNLVSQKCLADRQGSSFVITGRGGVPSSPFDTISATNIPDHLGSISNQTASNNSNGITAESSNSSIPDRIVEAQGWMINAQGQISLIATAIATPAQVWSNQTQCVSVSK